MKFKENQSKEKLRGGYYTPLAIANFILKWVLKKNPQLILEPSCGDGSFIKALGAQMGAPHASTIKFVGVEILKEEADKSREMAFFNKNIAAEIHNNNFLEWALTRLDNSEKFDAIVGNPPYIRYQYLSESDQKFSEQIFSYYWLSFTKHTNAWVPFVIASLGLLSSGGRLAMVIPSELLHVLHAGSLRKFLLSQCSKILIIDPNNLLFDEALQGTIILMLEKKHQLSQDLCDVAIASEPNNNFLNSDPELIFNNANYVSSKFLNGKWMKLLLSAKELEVFEGVSQLDSIKKFSEIASVDVGIVTGANKFFLVDNKTVLEYDLQNFVKPMFGRSEHCSGIIYNESVHHSNAVRGLPTNFIHIPKEQFEKLPLGVQRYIKYGESQNLHTRYKCRIRSPWYSVPSVYVTNLGMLKRSHKYPRLILNKAGAYTTDTAYRIGTSLDPINFVYCFINSLTALTAELGGRHYGGGVLELVPSEIEKLLIPIVSIKNADINELDSEIKDNHDADMIFEKQNEKILKNAGITSDENRIIHNAWLRVKLRRHRLLGTETKEEEKDE